MKGSEKVLVKLLEGSDKRFVVPVYQRNYSWTKDQCSQMYDDIVALAKNDEECHFFGSVVSKADMDKRILIDGQQRITTTFLFLLALKRAIDDKKITFSNDRLSEKINKKYLIDEWDESDLKLKLKLIKSDQYALTCLYRGDANKYVNNSKVTQNYLFFYESIINSEIEAEQFEDAIRRLMIIDIKLETNDDPQRIFESLNSTGLELSEADKIRNFILMGLDEDTQEEYFSKYWKEIERNTSVGEKSETSAFVRFWLAAVKRKTPNIKNVYVVFKDYVTKNDMSNKHVLKELKRYSKYYSFIINGNTDFDDVNILLRRFKRLESTVSYPFLLCLFNYFYSDGYIDNNEKTCLLEILSVIETYIFRRWVCGVPANALNKIFETLHKDVVKGLEGSSLEIDQYVEVMKRVLLDKDVSGRFPKNPEFEESIRTRDFYRIARYKFYLYNRLENADNKERVNVIENLLNGNYSVEHIMPQSLSHEWKLDLGENAEEIHERWLNKIANLTLTAYNSEYSNKPFKDKKFTENKTGFNESGLRINNYVKDQDEWTEVQLQEREDLMVKKFFDLWPMISTDFEWPKPVTFTYSLADEFECSYRDIVSFSMGDKTFDVETWKEMAVAVVHAVYRCSPTSLMDFLPKGVAFPGPYFRDEPADGFVEVGKGVFFTPNSSTQTKLDLLRAVFDSAGIDYSELVFELN